MMEKLRRNEVEDCEETAFKEATFAERRRLLVHRRLPLARFKEKFPWLLDHDEVSVAVINAAVATHRSWAHLNYPEIRHST